MSLLNWLIPKFARQHRDVSPEDISFETDQFSVPCIEYLQIRRSEGFEGWASRLKDRLSHPVTEGKFDPKYSRVRTNQNPELTEMIKSMRSH